MKRLALLTTALVALTSSAFAADMAVKAPPVSPFVSNTGSGWYLGLGVEGVVGAGSVSGTSFPALNSTNLTAGGGSLTVDVGRIWNSCFLNSWCQLELDGKWRNISGTTSVGSVNSQWAVSGEFDVGAQFIDTITSALNQNLPFPTFDPSGLLPRNVAVATTPRQYFGAAVEAMKIGGNFGSAQGETWVVAGGPVTGYRWQTLNAAGQPNGGSINVYARAMFTNRGVTFGNVFAAPAVPLTVNASAKMATTYEMGVHYDFGIGR